MEWLKIIGEVLSFLISIWKDKTNPENVRLQLAAKITQEMNDDVESFKVAISENDATAMSAHFELLRERVSKATGANSARGPGNIGHPK